MVRTRRVRPAPAHPQSAVHPAGRGGVGAARQEDIGICPEDLLLQQVAAERGQPRSGRPESDDPRGGTISRSERLGDLQYGAQIGLEPAEPRGGEQSEESRRGKSGHDVVGLAAIDVPFGSVVAQQGLQRHRLCDEFLARGCLRCLLDRRRHVDSGASGLICLS